MDSSAPLYNRFDKIVLTVCALVTAAIVGGYPLGVW
jgi:hypothetical protein